MQPHGLDLSVGVMNESTFWNARDNGGLTPQQELEHVADIANVVGRSKPTNLVAYYVHDEPYASDAPRLRRWVDAVKRNDPHHPTLICICFKEALGAFADFTDILAPDPYPGFPGGPMTKVSDFMIEARRVVRGRKPVLAVLQAFGAPQGRPIPGKNPPVLPTPNELRCMTYLALVHQARGVYYFSYNFNGPLPEYWPDRWAELKKLAGEMRDRKDVILADAGDLQVRQPATGDPVYARVIRHGDQIHVLAVNTQRQPVQGKFHVAGIGSAELNVLDEHRNIRVTDGRFTDDFEPLAVHWYVTAAPSTTD